MRALATMILRTLAACLLLFAGIASAETIEFSLDRPDAKQVFLAGEMTDWDANKLPMVRSADGKWRVAVDLAPGQWVYKFIVDGQWIADPGPARNDADGQGGRHSFLFVGDGPWREQKNISHGKVETTMLPSAAWGHAMKVHVYLPPGFSKSRKYPVLMLLHGSGMDADQWYRTGQVQVYMDNLIADKTIEPFVVVMPSSADVFYIGKSDVHITRELPPWLESRYGQTISAKQSAAAGMSMGGFGAVILPLHHPDLFGLSYALSSYFPPDEVAAMQIPKPLPFGLVMATGDRDRVTESVPPFLKKLEAQDADFIARMQPGGHTWQFFSTHMADMLQTANRYFTTGQWKPTAPGTSAQLGSPGNVLQVAVSLDNGGHASYSVSRNGKLVIAPSRLGFLLTNGAKLDHNFAIASSSTRSSDGTWEQPWGERRYVRNHYNELRIALKETKDLKRELDVVFRVYDDGIGFRYEFPDQPSLKDVCIAEELTEFVVADPATAWWIPAGEWNRYEYLYRKTPLAEVGQAHTPMTVRTQDGLHIAFHEAALVDYSSMWLRRVEGQRFRANLSPSSSGPKVWRQAPFNTPWRTMQIADSAGGLYMSNLELNLNEPNKLGDVSWFKPFKYVGIWWGMHLDAETWKSGPKHGATTANTKRYIDFAAKHGFRGVLVEGWNVGWDGDWFANGWDFSFTKPYPDFDIEALAAYAKSKGVHLIGHHETGGNIAVYEPQLDAALDLYQRLGIDSVKTGYVADAGGIQARGADGKIHFEWHDGQVMSRHHLKVVMEAAKRHIAINPHEPIKDTGLRRTYPNWVAREGARGMEYNAWGSPPNPPEHEANLVFTRMLSGPMDFTPGVLSLQGKKQKLQSTLAKQLALYVVLYSPIQMAADLPENYEANLAPFQFIKDVPTDWSDTRVLNGEVGDFVTFARKDRNSENWYIGAVTDEQARTLSVKLDFLSPGVRYRAQIYRDGPAADWNGNARDIVIEEKTVTRSDSLSLALAPGGGQAVRFVRLRK